MHDLMNILQITKTEIYCIKLSRFELPTVNYNSSLLQKVISGKQLRLCTIFVLNVDKKV
jgi:hypothetical protein